jgi:hypothetical protein
VIWTCVVILRLTNVAPPRFLARSGEGKWNTQTRRNRSAVLRAWPRLTCSCASRHPAASGALRKRIIGALEAGAISMVSSDPALIPDVDVIVIDLAPADEGGSGRRRAHRAAPLRVCQPRSTTGRTRRHPVAGCSRTRWNERSSGRSRPAPQASASSRPLGSGGDSLTSRIGTRGASARRLRPHRRRDSDRPVPRGEHHRARQLRRRT